MDATRNVVVLTDVDDTLRILTAIKRTWGDRVTTIFVRQGHYANDSDIVSAFPPADVTVASIADVVGLSDEALGRGAWSR